MGGIVTRPPRARHGHSMTDNYGMSVGSGGCMQGRSSTRVHARLRERRLKWKNGPQHSPLHDHHHCTCNTRRVECPGDCVRPVRAAAGALRNRCRGAAASLHGVAVLGTACAVIRRSAGACVDFGARAGSAWVQSNRPTIYRRWLRGFPVSCAPRGRVCVATAGEFTRRRNATARHVDYFCCALCAAGEQANDGRAEQLRSLAG